MLKDPLKTTFREIYDELQPGDPLERREYLCGEVTEDGARRMYTHNPLVPDGDGVEALTRRLEYSKGAALVRQAMVNEHGPAVMRLVFRCAQEGTDRNLWEEMTRGDLYDLHYQLQRLQRQTRLLP